ncbi:MAG: hypothetical protein LBV12_09185 [Puniceicoccales bacterium]|nr:hypothetical protein [Puniceicoccales bacterium]
MDEGETIWQKFCFWLGRTNAEEKISRIAPNSSIADWVKRTVRSSFHYPERSWYLKIKLSSNKPEAFPIPIQQLASSQSSDSFDKLTSRLLDWMEMRPRPGRIEAIALSDEHDCYFGDGERGNEFEVFSMKIEGDVIVYRFKWIDPTKDKFKICFYQKGLEEDSGELRETWVNNPRRIKFTFPTVGIKTLPHRVTSETDPNFKAELSSARGSSRLFSGDKEVTDQYDDDHYKMITNPAEEAPPWVHICAIDLPLWRIKFHCSVRKKPQKEKIGIQSLPMPQSGTYRKLDNALPETMGQAEPLVLFGAGVYYLDNKGNVLFASDAWSDAARDFFKKLIRKHSVDSIRDWSFMAFEENKVWKYVGTFMALSEHGVIIFSQEPFIRDTRRVPKDSEESIDVMLKTGDEKQSSWPENVIYTRNPVKDSDKWKESYMIIPVGSDGHLPEFNLFYTKQIHDFQGGGSYSFIMEPVRPTDEDRHQIMHENCQRRESSVPWKFRSHDP